MWGTQGTKAGQTRNLEKSLFTGMFNEAEFAEPFKHEPHKMIKRAQIIRR